MRHRRCCRRIFRAAGSPAARTAVEKSDCLLTVGLRRVDSTSAFFTDAIPASAIHLNARSINLGLEKFLRPGDLILAEDGTSNSGATQMRLPAGCVFVTQAI
jgi:TPP-dependent 2-oxoacid decarboxylase